MPRIEILPDHLISQIAAGEVVERPASVVKELVENSIDAGATRIEIDLEVGGKRRIRVLDDGEGMERDDALRAFDRHATSKIATIEDLEAVATLGFRGEALASIAAVARVELTTARRPGEGFKVRIEGGRVRRAEPAPAPAGTLVEVASLFFNVPARRRFLKTPRTELQRAAEVAQAYALARPGVGLVARHEGRSLIEAPAAEGGAAGLRRRVESLFGADLAARLADIPPLERQGLRVWGLIGDPSSARGRRRFTFVNRRLLRDRALMATFYRAVRDEWRNEDFPALFLFLDLPGEALDVNVHPQKSEVRFRDSSVLDHLYTALRAGLAASRGEEKLRPSRFDTLPKAPLAWRGGDSAVAETRSAWRFEGDEEKEHPRIGGERLPQSTLAPLEPRPVPLSGRSGEVRPFRILAQYKGSILLLEGPDGLYLIDQHVAHERILYERIRRNLLADAPQSQTLLDPHLLDLSPPEVLRLEPMLADLETCGIEAQAVSETTLAIAAVPAGMDVEQVLAALEHLAQQPLDDESTGDLRRRLVEDAAASMSCRAAVKMHDPLTGEEMEHLVTELFEAEQPYTCPHGRPVLLRFSDADLERDFKRR